MKDEAKIKSKHKRKFLLKFLLQQKLDQTNRTNVTAVAVVVPNKQIDSCMAFCKQYPSITLIINKGYFFPMLQNSNICFDFVDLGPESIIS